MANFSSRVGTQIKREPEEERCNSPESFITKLHRLYPECAPETPESSIPPSPRTTCSSIHRSPESRRSTFSQLSIRSERSSRSNRYSNLCRMSRSSRFSRSSSRSSLRSNRSSHHSTRSTQSTRSSHTTSRSNRLASPIEPPRSNWTSSSSSSSIVNNQTQIIEENHYYSPISSRSLSPSTPVISRPSSPSRQIEPTLLADAITQVLRQQNKQLFISETLRILSKHYSMETTPPNPIGRTQEKDKEPEVNPTISVQTDASNPTTSKIDITINLNLGIKQT